MLPGAAGNLRRKKAPKPPLLRGATSRAADRHAPPRPSSARRRAKCGFFPTLVRHGGPAAPAAARTPMFRTLLKSKIHRAVVTHCELHYEGSCAIDEDLLDAADLRENEQVHIWNVDNGERLVTYALRAPRGSGIVSLNGSAARKAAAGDLVIIAAFALVAEAEVDRAVPRLVFVDEHNRIKPRPPFVGHTDETVAREAAQALAAARS